MSDEIRYSYKPSAITLALASGFFAICTVFIYQSAQGEGGLIFEGLIELSPDQAKPVFWLLTVLSALFCLVGLFVLYRVLTRQGEIVLDPTTLIVPPLPLASEPRKIPLTDIVALSSVKIGRRQLLRLRLRQGSLDLAVSKFTSAGAYDDFLRDLQKKLPVGP